MIHLDLKSSNVLLSRDGVAKIADVGLARILTRGDTNVSAEGTFEWAAPEILLGQKCSEKADIYSMGVIMWELITGERPHFRSLRPLRVPEEVPADMAGVVSSCRASAPNARPSARELFDLLINAEGANSRPPFRALSTVSSFPSDKDSGFAELPEGAGEGKSSPRLGKGRLHASYRPKSGALSAPTTETLMSISESNADGDKSPPLTALEGGSQ
ncbi:hypothetical protein WJX84_006036 [Apatococcus fuscideae]